MYEPRCQVARSWIRIVFTLARTTTIWWTYVLPTRRSPKLRPLRGSCLLHYVISNAKQITIVGISVGNAHVRNKTSRNVANARNHLAVGAHLGKHEDLHLVSGTILDWSGDTVGLNLHCRGLYSNTCGGLSRGGLS